MDATKEKRRYTELLELIIKELKSKHGISSTLWKRLNVLMEELPESKTQTSLHIQLSTRLENILNKNNLSKSVTSQLLVFKQELVVET